MSGFAILMFIFGGCTFLVEWVLVRLLRVRLQIASSVICERLQTICLVILPLILFG